MKKTAMEMAFRELMIKERDKNVVRWTEGDIRRDITVILWNVKKARKTRFEEKQTKEAACNGY